MVDYQLRMSAAGRDHDGHAIRFPGRRQKRVNGRVVYHLKGFGELGVIGRREDFLLGHAFGSGGSVRPEFQFLTAVECQDKGGEKEEKGEFHGAEMSLSWGTSIGMKNRQALVVQASAGAFLV
jgi:hypothetical protein